MQLGLSLDWYDSVFEVIDLRSFSNLWYWIGLAVFWSSVSHWILGVPYDSIMRAKRGNTIRSFLIHNAVLLSGGAQMVGKE